MIYLDYAATSPMKLEVLESFTKALTQDFANPSSAHKLGKSLHKRVEQIQKELLKDFDSKGTLLFTSGATESNNTVIKGINYLPDDEILYDAADHPSVVKVVETLSVKRVSFSSKDLHSLLNEKTRLLILTHVHNLSGKINPYLSQLEDIKNKYPRVHIHVDGAQAFGKFPIDHISCDSYGFSGHKMGAPKGIGGLFLAPQISINTLIDGGQQQDGKRSGTINYPMIEAVYEAYQRKDSLEPLYHLKETVMGKIGEYFDFPFEKEETSPYILLARCEKISSDILLRFLEMKDIYVSSSSACSSKIKGFNPTYLAMGIQEKHHKNIIRISFSSLTTFEEIERFCKAIEETFSELGHLLRK